MSFFYAFEAKSIQNYLFSGGKLKHVVGGSDLVDRICRYPEKGDGSLESDREDLIGQIIANLHLPSFSDDKFSRRAGGAFMVGPVDNKDELIRFRQTLHLMLAAKIPGLQFTDAVVDNETIKDAIPQIQAKLNASRNRQENVWPFLHSFVQEDQRTGRAAVGQAYEDESMLDLARWAKEQNKKDGRDSIGQKFLADDLPDRSQYQWPDDLQDICGPDAQSERNGMIALVHADGNALGSLLQTMASADVDGAGFRAFSEAIARATRLAAQNVTDKVLLPDKIKEGDKPILPARPLVLGGDDLSIFIRGDLALEFTEEFLKQFEERTKDEFDALREQINVLPDRLSAGAGILYMNAKFPFDQCANLAEEIATQAKSKAKKLDSENIPSGLLYYRNTFALAGNKEQIEADRTAHLDGQKVTLGAGPYFLSHTPKLEDFEEVCKKLLDADDKVSGIGALREAVGLLQTDPAKARQKYDRWVTVTKGRQKDYFTDLMVLVATCLGIDKVSDEHLLIAPLQHHENKVCLLADVLVRKAVNDG